MFLKYLTPSQGLHKTLLHMSSGHVAKQAPAAATRGIRATCSQPMSFPGISQPQAGWSFLAGAAGSQLPFFPRFSCSFLHAAANKQEHAALPQLQKGGQEQAVATRTVEVAHTLLPRAARSRYSECSLPRQNPTHAAPLDYRQQHLLSTS